MKTGISASLVFSRFVELCSTYVGVSCCSSVRPQFLTTPSKHNVMVWTFLVECSLGKGIHVFAPFTVLDRMP